jgi:hypothetical protein
MFKNYSTNDLILYLYNETDLSDSVFVQHAIDHDEDVKEEFCQLVAVKELLDRLKTYPSHSTVDSIMAYSQLHSYAQ